MEYVKYIDKKRKQSGGNQSEIPSIQFYPEKAVISGYQKYEMNKDGQLFTSSIKIQNQWKLLSTLNLKNIQSICDLGCSSGANGRFVANKYSIPELYLFDHDTEYLAISNKLQSWLPISNIYHKLEIQKFQFGIDTLNTYDIIITLSTIHWFYSSTTSYGCLFTIIGELAKSVKKALIIEWIDPLDPAIKLIQHIHMNPTIHKTAYTKDNFMKALSQYFKTVKSLGNSLRFREIYYCII